jgi:hypothetical protein
MTITFQLEVDVFVTVCLKRLGAWVEDIQGLGQRAWAQAVCCCA